MDKNILIQADNLYGMEWLLDNGYKGKVDLVYIDPPFATGCNFGIDDDGRVATVSKSKNGTTAYSDKLKGKEFIEFLRKRVELIHQLLSDKGSLYLHIDYKIGHYVKVMLDEIFGIENFRNDITRIKCNPKNFQRIGYGNIKDMILFYTKGPNPVWNNPSFEKSEEEIARLYNKIDDKGRRYTTVPLHAPGESLGETGKPFKGILPPKGRHWRCSIKELEKLDQEGRIEWSGNGNPRKINYATEHTGTKSQDIWEFKDPAYPIYPTEKNLDMLKFIIEASSNPDSIVLDCFCGSGSTLFAAQSCGRNWIGLDNSEIAIETTKNRFLNNQDLFSLDNMELILLDKVDLSMVSEPENTGYEPRKN